MKIMGSLFSATMLAAALASFAIPAVAGDSAGIDVDDSSLSEIAFSTTTAVSPAEAVPPQQGSVPPGGCSGPNPMCPVMSMPIEQLEKLNALKNDYLDAIDPKVAKLKSYKRHLLADLATKEIDRDAAIKLQTKINDVKGDIATARLKYQMDKLAIMTPDEKERLRRHMLIKSLFGFRHNRHHHHFGPGMARGRSQQMGGPGWLMPGPSLSEFAPPELPVPEIASFELGFEPGNDVSGVF